MTTKLTKPTIVRLRAYNSGFGDCLLLTVMYSDALPDGRSERHMLVDMGTSAAMDSDPSLADIAAVIEQHCSGRLDVVVATHRHLDHVSGFGIDKVSHILDRLRPGLVILPWTDLPQARSGAKADLVGGEAGRVKFVQTGDLVEIDKEMPGVKVQVLAPPPLADVSHLLHHAKTSDEYWSQMAIDDAIAPTIVASDPESQRQALDVLAAPGGMGAAALLVRSLNDDTIPHGSEIVEGVDDVDSNTNVILLVTIGKRTLLLAAPGALYNTDDLPPNVWWMDIESPTVGNAKFVFSQGPPTT